ncbi:MAG: hypothetical protein QOH49_4972 [Acidobacteriota bacterium]|jgi:hypothetical protein|nr:hypothetical protein [Acidobacteriota bacterium]
MNKKDDGSRLEPTEKEKLVEALIGSEEDFEDEECSEEYLEAFGINPDSLVSEFKEHLQEKARRHQAESGSVPDSISNALRAVRDHLKSSDPMNVDPDDHIDRLLSGQLARGMSADQYARALRRKEGEEMSEEDEKILDALEAELEEDDPNPPQ